MGASPDHIGRASGAPSLGGPPSRNEWAFGVGLVSGFVAGGVAMGQALFGMPFRLFVPLVLALACACTAALITGRTRVGGGHDAWKGAVWGVLGAVGAWALMGVWIVYVAASFADFD